MNIDIDTLSIERLEVLNHRIGERLKFLVGVQAHRDMMAFNIGTQVSCDLAKRGRVFGTITKFNHKTVSVLTEADRQRNITSHLLTRIKDATPKQRFVYADEAYANNL